MILELFDVSNWCRRVYEKDTTGLALRNLFTTAYTNPNPCIYVFDCKTSKAMRRKIYPEYKEGRTPADDAFYIQLELFEMLLAHTNKMRVKVPGFEADDVIAKIIRGRKPTDPEIELRSNDGDFMVLQGPGVKMLDISKKLEHIHVDHLRLYKTMCGDTTDNIHGIPGFGPKTFNKMVAAGLVDNWHDMLHIRAMGDASKESLGLTDKHFKYLQENFGLILSYWDVINFFPVPDDLFQQNLKVGTPNMAVANAILATVFQ